MSNVKSMIGKKPMYVGMPIVSGEDLAKAETFKAEPGDVFIVTYPKCGTTWCQNLCHQLRTGGDTDFEEISEEGVVPWLEVSGAIGIDVALPQKAKPRCFKTHQRLSALSHLEEDGAKYICIMRDPEPTLKSFFKFMYSKGLPIEPDVNVFVTQGFQKGGNMYDQIGWGGEAWEFMDEFWKCRKLPNVLLLFFEDMQKDLEGQIVRIADFMGVVPDAALRAKVAEYGSFKWMQEHDHLFDDHHIGERVAKIKGKGKGKGKDEGKDGKGSGKDAKEGDKGYGARIGAAANSVKKVGLDVGDEANDKVSEETRAILARRWQEVMEPVTGCKSYADLLDAFRKETA